jgi:pyruvate/2-oxoglutarate dehydrogenase complex dihydrolipoamide acyltransferase (E2) component
MATFEIKMPKLGESVTEGTIVSWSVNVGDVIAEDDVLFEVTTAKVNAEVPSPVGGKLLKINYNVDDTVPVGEVVALVALEGDEAENQPLLLVQMMQPPQMTLLVRTMQSPQMTLLVQTQPSQQKRQTPPLSTNGGIHPSCSNW